LSYFIFVATNNLQITILV